MNNFKESLKQLENNLINYYKLPFFEKRNLIACFEKNSEEHFNELVKSINLSRLSNTEYTSIVNFKEFLNSLIESKFVIISKYENEIAYLLFNKSFELGVLIAIQQNRITDVKELNAYPFILSLAYIVSIAKGKKYGQHFIEKFVAFSDESNIPIYLYCEKSLISYYKKLNFQIAKDTPNYEGNYLLVHFPVL